MSQKENAILVLSETKELNKEQKALLNYFGKIKLLTIPEEGMSVAQQMSYAAGLMKGDDAVIFGSPIPVLFGKTCYYSSRKEGKSIYVFHNKKELKQKFGKVTFILPDEGWKLIKI